MPKGADIGRAHQNPALRPASKCLHVIVMIVSFRSLEVADATDAD
jgi:hypothetical protein